MSSVFDSPASYLDYSLLYTVFPSVTKNTKKKSGIQYLVVASTKAKIVRTRSGSFEMRAVYTLRQQLNKASESYYLRFKGIINTAEMLNTNVKTQGAK